MSPDNHVAEFLRERDRISHDLVKNVFFAELQPCWDGTGRFGPDDVIYGALLGRESDQDIAAEAICHWRSSIGPAIERLVDAVPVRLGRVQSDEWRRDMTELGSSCAVISALSFDGVLSEAEARSNATQFWTAVDTMYRILTALKTDFARYFPGRDGAIFNE